MRLKPDEGRTPPPADPEHRYHTVAIFLHWITAALVVLNWPIGFFGEELERVLGEPLVPLHKSIGLTVLALTLIRLGWRLLHSPPDLPATMARWRTNLARTTQWALHLLLIAVPLTGWLRVSPGRYPLSWFGIVELPKFPIERDSAEAALASFSHEWLAWTMVALAAVHVAAALHHHFRLRDAVLSQILPVWATNRKFQATD